MHLRTCLATVVLAAAAAAVAAQRPPAPAASPSPSPPPGSVAASVEPVVERVLAQHGEPCGSAAVLGVPCFPVTIGVPAPEYSVARSLEEMRLNVGRSGQPPPPPGGRVPPSGISFDPVCVGKSVLKAVGGKNDRYYLYRIWAPAGESAILRDRPFEPGKPGAPVHPYELIREIHGECAAIAAWRAAEREAYQRNRARRASASPAPAETAGAKAESQP